MCLCVCVCVCVCSSRWYRKRKEPPLSASWQSVGSSQPSCRAVQGVVRYHWLRIKAAICMEAASVQLFIALPVSVCLSLHVSLSLLLIFYPHIFLIFVVFFFFHPPLHLLNCLHASLSLSWLCFSPWVSQLAGINKGLLTSVCPLWSVQWASWDFRRAQ